MTPEARVKAAVKRVLQKHNAYYFYPVAGSIGSRPGIPDIVVCHKGQFIGIECKSGSRKPTGLQQGQLDAINAAGGIALVINESNVHGLDELLGGM